MKNLGTFARRLERATGQERRMWQSPLIFSQISRLALGESINRPWLPWTGDREETWDGRTQRARARARAIAKEASQIHPGVNLKHTPGRSRIGAFGGLSVGDRS